MPQPCPWVRVGLRAVEETIKAATFSLARLALTLGSPYG